MFEALGIETLTPRQASVMLGLLLGVLFGVLAEVTRFCLRRAVAGDPAERRSAGGVWLAALVSAILGTQIAVVLGLISFDGHRFMAPDLPWLAVVAGGLLFGVGMVMTRGCISRLTVLLGSGNLRALLVLAVFAITAHSTLKGVLAPVRTTLGSATIPLGDMTSLAVLPGGALVWTALLVAVGVALAIRSGARPLHLGLAALLGLLVPAAWIGTGFVLFDEFDPIAMEGLSTTSSSAEGLFWLIASSSIPAGFGTGFIGGIVAGAFVGSVTSGPLSAGELQHPGANRALSVRRDPHGLRRCSGGRLHARRGPLRGADPILRGNPGDHVDRCWSRARRPGRRPRASCDSGAGRVAAIRRSPRA